MDSEELDWYSSFEVKNLLGMTAADVLEYKGYSIDKINPFGKSDIMSRILLLSLW